MPDAPLLARLATIYAGEQIRYPHLKAVTLAQWMLESGRASSELAKQHYNFGGLKWRPQMTMYARKVKYNAHDGEDFYCKFATLEQFIGGYWVFINRPPYSGWESHVATAEEYIRFVGPIYTPDPGYADEVLALVPEAQALLYKVVHEPHDATVAGGVNLGTLVLDPGHGGDQNMSGSSANNAISVSGVKEKKLTLDFCLILRDRLMEQASAAGERVRVVLTRDSDVNLAGSERAGLAHEVLADALICLHFNGHRNNTVRGCETFYRAASNGNLNLDEDLVFVRAVHEGLMEGMRLVDSKAVDRGVKGDDQSGPGALGLLNDKLLGNHLRTRKCVAAYVEAEFITNPRVDKLLVSGGDAIDNRTRVMSELAKAIRAYMRAARV